MAIITARDAYYLTYATIQKDVLRYGPIEASFDVYDDFPSYKSGKHAFKMWCVHELCSFPETGPNDLQYFMIFQTDLMLVLWFSGVYVKSKNATLLGGHAVKLIGWGEEFGVPYWLLVNSWNEDWGDKGLFKIRRGTNECGIDSATTAGVPVTI